MRIDVQVRRDDLTATRVVEAELPELARGQARLRVDKFAITSNNVTYAVLGEALDYWAFFPATGVWGCVPAWGFADVVCSRDPSLPEGTRLYGFVPFSTHLTISPARSTERGLVDSSPHRVGLPGAYNWYQREHVAGTSAEDRFAVLRPLFVLSFLLAEHLHGGGFFGTRAVVLSSASSKAAIGTAARLAELGGAATIGLTSVDRLRFVRSLDLYDEVATYDTVSSLPVQPCVYVDFAGTDGALSSVRGHYGSDLRHMLRVGGTRQHRPWAGHPAGQDPGQPLFFAPAEMAARIKEWGRAGFDARVEAAWEPFLTASAGWLRVDRQQGREAVCDAWRHLVTGGPDPSVGYVRSVGG